MEATLDGEPKVLKREGGKVTFQVRALLKPNVKAFDDFATRLTARLEKMARDKDEFGIKAEPKKDDRGEYFQFNPDWVELMPRRFEAAGGGIMYRSKGTCVVAVSRCALTCWPLGSPLEADGVPESAPGSPSPRPVIMPR